MEIVIKIPEEMYEWINDVNKFYEDYGISDFVGLIKNGTVLPKGHGKIIDESAITEIYTHKTEPKEVNGIQIYPRIEIIGTNAPTIIEADRSEK